MEETQKIKTIKTSIINDCISESSWDAAVVEDTCVQQNSYRSFHKTPHIDCKNCKQPVVVEVEAVVAHNKNLDYTHSYFNNSHSY